MKSIVVARARNNVIGSKNDLPWYLPADLKHFKLLTTGKTVVMGRKTFDSIVERLGTPLPNRTNIVLTRQPTIQFEEVQVIHDIKDMPDGDIAVIGGAEVYTQALPLIDTLYITEVHADIDGDVTFPILDMNEWHEVSRESHSKDNQNQYDFDFVVYKRI